MLSRIHLIVGVVGVPRLLYRSAHIYLLFSALLNLLLGSYLELRQGGWRRGFQYVGSLFVFGSVALFLYGFFVETPLGHVERPVMREGIYFCLVGVILHTIATPWSPKSRQR